MSPSEKTLPFFPAPVEKVEADRKEAKKEKFEQEEQILLQKCMLGDKEAYGQIVAHYQLRVYNLAFRIVNNRTAAEDLTQEAFIRGYKYIHRFELGRRFLPWIFRIAANLSKNFLKSPTRRELPLLIEPSNHNKTLESPYARVEQKELAQRVENALQKIPVMYRIPLTLKHVEGLSYEEMKQVLNLPVRVLKMRVCRARSKLCQLLKNEEKDGS